MKLFNGFSQGKTETIPLHAQFFSEVMPLIDDLAEMKVVLFCYWALWQKEGEYRYLVWDDFVNNPELMAGLALIDSSQSAEALLQAGLDKAAAHQILLSASVTLQNGEFFVYLLNTARGRTAIQQLAAGNWRPDDQQRIEILPERPTIFKLYEENIGVIGSMMRDELLDAEKEFSYEWIVEAIKLAVAQNKRSWAYIRAILTRWQQEGRPDETNKRSHQSDAERFLKGKWANYIES